MGKRARGKRRGLGYHLLALAAAYWLGYLLLTPRYGLGVVLLIGFVVLLLWVLFVMPTRCDFHVQGRGCRRKVHGKFNGCHDHAQAKRDAIFAALRMRNPGMAFRVMWLDRNDGGNSLGGREGGRPDPADSRANRGQALFNTASLVVAAIGSVAGVLALFVAK
ncbi:MAG: hypothetical protein L0H84_05575 [Pseudonocardia sp.]|nr:hypothetical protein [Pseudonocardia sp.]